MPSLKNLLNRAVERYRSEGARETARATARFLLRQFAEEQGRAKPKSKKKRHEREIDLTPYGAFGRRSVNDDYDVVLVTDLRFPGGSGQSSAEELKIHTRYGIRTGLIHLPSYKMRFRSAASPAIDAAIRNGTVELLNGEMSEIRTKLLLFRHPTILDPCGDELPSLHADHVALVVNHPPVKFDTIEYLLPFGVRRLREAYGVQPQIYPIGPLVRSAIDQAYDRTIRMEEDDWVNVFEVERFCMARQVPVQGVLKIGRHSRPQREKWPNDPDAIRLAYPEDSGIEVHILGGAEIPEAILGRRPRNWTVHEFGKMDVVEFLRGIDVFVYFHHPDWVEAFGRVIVEAMAAGLPVVLPPHFEPLLGDAALYCEPEGVRGVLELLREPGYYRERSDLSRRVAMERFSHDVHLRRLQRAGVILPENAACEEH